MYQARTSRSKSLSDRFSLDLISGRGVRVPRSLGFRSQGTRNPPDKSFLCILGTLMSEYNLPSTFEQITTGSRVPENGEPTRVPGSRVPSNGEPARISSLRLSEDRVPKNRNPPGFRVLRKGEPTVDFAFPGS
jgi:hypothetical protein